MQYRQTIQLGGALVIGLLAVDLLIDGPVSRNVGSWLPGGAQARQRARQQGVIAWVYGQPIHGSQLDRAIWVYEKVNGVSGEQVPRRQLLDQLIDDALLMHELQGHRVELVKAEEVDAAVSRFRLKFETSEAFQTALVAEGFADEKALRDFFESDLRAEKLIRQRIEASVRVSEEEARKWFEGNARSLATPRRIRVRQIFLPTLDKDAEEVKQRLEVALGDLKSRKKEFGVLASELSEDEGSKNRGGDLGWFSSDRMPLDFVMPVLKLKQGELSLVRSKLGWHLVEVTEQQPEAEADFERQKSEIHAALVTEKTKTAISNFKKELRSKASGEILVIQDL